MKVKQKRFMDTIRRDRRANGMAEGVKWGRAITQDTH